MVRKLGIVVMVVMALVLAACTSSPMVSPTTTTLPKPLPAIDLSATPAGWVPVAYGDAQVSVPAYFGVYYPGSCRVWATPGALFLGPLAADTAPRSCTAPGYLPTTTVDIVSASVFKVPSGYVRLPTVLNGVPVYKVMFSGPMPLHKPTGVEYYAPSLGVVVKASGPMTQKVIATLTRSPRAVALAPGTAAGVPSSWRSVTFEDIRFSVPRNWVITGPYTWTLCGPGPVALYGGVLLDTDHNSWPHACPPRQYPAEPRNGLIVEGSNQLGSNPLVPDGSFSTHCLTLHVLTACPATSLPYSILILKVTVPGRSKPVYVSIGLAGNGMVARTILYSLRPATSSTSKVVTSPTASHWWVTLAFADRDLGALAEETGAGWTTSTNCKLSVFTTSDGRDSWTVPLLLSHDASCIDGGESGGATDEMAMTGDGAWFLATPQGLYSGRVGHPDFKLFRASRLAPRMPTDSVCQVASFGKAVWVVLAWKCGQLVSTTVLLYSDNDGSTWARRSVPLASVVEGTMVTSAPDSLAVQGEQSAWILGWSNDARTRLAVARTNDGGLSWHTSALPCRSPETLSGLLTVSGNSLLALCQGEVYTGYGEMAVVASGNGGGTWTQRCNNGPSGILAEVGSCPDAGYPVKVVAMPNGVFLMALDYIGGVYVSLDGGRAWKPGITSSSPNLTLSQGTGAVWMLGIETFLAGERPAVSTNGRTWRRAAFP